MYAALPLNYDPTVDYFPATPALTQDHARALPVLGPQTTVADVVPWTQRGLTHSIHNGTGGCCCAKCLGMTSVSTSELSDELFDGNLNNAPANATPASTSNANLPYSVANNIQYSIPGNGDYLDEAIAAYTTTAAGMPILNSSPSSPTAIFLDFDGDSAGGYDVATAYDTDGNAATFSVSEQTDIVKAWRQVSAYFAMFDMNVTTIKPAAGIETAWLAVGNNISGGYAWVGTFPTTAGASGFNNSGDARTRVSGMVHEIGHIMGLSHQSTYNTLGVKTAEYASKKDDLHGTIMGVDFDGVVKKWIWDHPSNSPSNLQDDLLVIANRVKAYQPAGGDGYRADDYGGTIALATPLEVVGGKQQIYGNIERAADVDVFSFTVSSAVTQIDVVPDYPGSLDAKLEIRDATGTILAHSHTNKNDQHLTLNLGTGTYYAYVSSAGDYGDVGLYSVKVASLPSNWRSQDINSTALYLGGSGRYDSVNNTWELEGSGAGLGSTSDNFQYTSGTMTGDGTITLRVDSLENTNNNAKTGIMIRSTTAGNSAAMTVAATPTSGQQFIRRLTNGAASSTTSVSAATFAPIWLRITKAGNNYSAFRSTDGTSWTQIGTTTSASLGTTFQVGLFSTSATNSNPSSVTMSNFSMTGFTAPAAGAVNGLTAPTDLAVVPGTDTNLNLSWTDIVGETGYRIERSTDGMFFTTVTTTAANITTYTDTGISGSNRYYYRIVAMNSTTPSVPGNVAQAVNKPSAVTNLTFTSWTATSIILNWRETNGETGYRIERSTDGTTYTSIATIAANIPSYTNTGLTANTTYYYRVIPTSSLGDGTTATVSGSTRLPQVTGLNFSTVATNQVTFNWTDIANETGYRIERSTDGTTFTTLTTTAANAITYTDSTVTPGNEYYYRVVGVNATSESASTTTIFTATPTASVLPSPWASADIGTFSGGTGGRGMTDLTSGTFKVISSGSDIWNTSDNFRYTYQTLIGNGSITARVVSQENTGGWVKAGAMIRESTNANSRYAMIMVTPSNGTAYQYRTTNGGSALNVAGTAGLVAPYWVRMTRTGNVMLGETSADGVTWTTVSSQTIAMSTTATIGLALSANTSTLLNTTTFSNVTVSNNAPTIATVAAASPSTVTGLTTNLTVTGADDHGEPNLTYTWTVTAKPSGAADPTFSANGTNAAKASTATFSRAGAYTFLATATDSSGLSVTSSVNVTVNQTLTSISVTPVTPTIVGGTTQQFAASGLDQFGNALTIQPSFTWNVVSGGVGTISGTGLYTSPLAGGTATVRATSGAISGTTLVTVTPGNTAPTVSTAASATPTPATGTTTALSVLGADNAGEANLTYQWSVTVKPATASNPTFSVNNSNAAKNSTATFSQAGAYTFLVTLTDAGGLTTTSSVNVTVNQTLTSIVATPSNATITAGTTQQFNAIGNDQFGNPLTVQPTLTWSMNSGAGSVSTTGLYTSTNTAGSAVVKVNSGAIEALIPVTITNNAPTIVNAASGSPNPVTGLTTALSVLGNDDQGESSLTYQWTVTAKPSGATDPTFDVNNSNAAKNSTATFSQAGAYTFLVTLTDAGGLSTTSSVNVTVNQTLTSLALTPATPAIAGGQTVQFNVTARDQFTNTISSTNTPTWSVLAGGVGSVSSTGLYTTPLIGGSATVEVTIDSVSTSTTVSSTRTNVGPSIVNAAAASPNPITGTTTALSVLGSDDLAESTLTYSWSTTSKPVTAADPTFDSNGTNSAKAAVATFTSAGNYTFQVTITDSDNATTTSSVSVTVDQTLTSVQLTGSPPSSLNTGSTLQFNATGFDQFAQAMTIPPTWTWSVTSGVGSIDSAGLYTAGWTAGNATIQVSNGSVNTSHVLTINAIAPAAPTNLTVTENQFRRATLTWTDNAPNETSYVIQYSQDNGATWSTLSTLNGTSSSGGTLSWTSKRLPLRTYQFRVYAANSVGNSANSNTVSWTSAPLILV
jgi:regulation of enolase protein 1 (concanavalin A-like superfamily)